LTPGVFDALVLIVVVVGLIAAAIRIRRDFQRGPRWPDRPVAQEPVADKPIDSEGESNHA
jgi:hypothetical protein